MLDLARDVPNPLMLISGDPNFGTPAHIIDAAAEASHAGRTGYAPAIGLPPLREALAKKVHERNSITADADQICVSTGACGALFTSLIGEYETWRRIRDSEGTEGWVLHSLLSGRRTALVMPWAKQDEPPINMFDRPDPKAGIIAHMQPGVITNVKACDGKWCRVMISMENARDLDGYVEQEKLWGVYPNEQVE